MVTMQRSFLDLKGAAFVVGGASGIGEAAVLAFAREGCPSITIADINTDAALKVATKAQECATALNFKCITVHIDVTDEKSVDSAVHEAVSEFGRIDYAVNCAGVTNKSPLSEYSTEKWDFVQNVNQKGIFFCVRAQLAQMKIQDPLECCDGDVRRPGQRGSIINIASIRSFVCEPLNAAYNTSKHAVLGITRTAAVDHAIDDIRCNAIAPGYIMTPLVESPKMMEQVLRCTTRDKTPAGRPGTPNEVADVIAFLSSTRASYVNGAVWSTDGGYMSC